MPLEIRELVIKVNVTAQTSPVSEADIYRTMQHMKQEWIESCVEKVIKKIEKSFDR